MRFVHRKISLHVLLAGCLLSSHSLTAQTSFGPEISYEDFTLHVRNLEVYQNKPAARMAYMQKQFSRLNITSSENACATLGLQAYYMGEQSDDLNTVVFADAHNAKQLAVLLEIAERVVTKAPHPKNSILFVVSNDIEKDRRACYASMKSDRLFSLANVQTQMPEPLVADLNALYSQIMRGN